MEPETPSLTEERGGPTIFFFGNKGHGTVCLETLLDHGARVTGICTRLSHRAGLFSIDGMRKRLGRARFHIRRSIGRSRFPHDPFEAFEAPASLARRNGIPVFDSAKLRTSGFLAALKTRKPDLILCCSFHRLIPGNVLGTCRLGAVNLHPGVLPERAGGTPNRWAIRLGDQETAVTAHLMTEQFDQGDVLFEHRIPIPRDADWGTLETIVSPVICEATRRVLDLVKGGEVLHGMPQPAGDHEMLPSLKGELLRVEWHMTSEEIARTCASIRPKGGAPIRVGGRDFTLYRVEVTPLSIREHTDVAPGTEIGTDATGCPIVRTSSGAVTIKEIVLAGRIVSGRYLAGALSGEA